MDDIDPYANYLILNTDDWSKKTFKLPYPSAFATLAFLDDSSAQLGVPFRKGMHNSIYRVTRLPLRSVYFVA